MKKMTQNDLAVAIGKTPAFISYVLSGQRRPNWATAKRLAIVTDTGPALWLEGTPEEMLAAIEKVG